MKAIDVLLKDLTDEQIRSLPKEWIAAYVGRPRNEVPTIDSASKLRLIALGIIALYSVATYTTSAPNFFFLILLLMYELQYVSLRKDKALIDFSYAKERYLAEVRALPYSGA
ncbi:hypothetical protein ACFOLC_16070 [Lysobacter cavernae]|uniref:Uncharacterized protein n=1 Tax=Lysobacter cavernae TaxID=1685901 RepID=A0ABV7RV13_9GAMM